MKLRVIIPDSHGNHIDQPAAAAFLADLKCIDPDEVIFLGDHVDAGGTFNSHQRNYTNEMCESYEDDCAAANAFLDAVQSAAPRAVCHYLEGNHEAHIERWASRNYLSHRDAVAFLEREGPAARLDLKRRGIAYYRRSVFYQGLAIPGCIRLGKCYFVHGISHAKHADAIHLQRFGASVVFGHIHRSMGRVERTVTSGGHGAWCPGTLAQLQPLYKHTAPSDWSHGYAVQDVLDSGHFEHTNVPIFGDRTIASIRRGEHAESPSVPEVRSEDRPAREAKAVEREIAKARKQAEGEARKVVKSAAKVDAVLTEAKQRRHGGPTAADCAAALKKHGNQVQAARALGISRFTLRHRLGLV